MRLVPNAKRIWLAQAETWPVIACMLGAVGWCSYMSMRHLFFSPDTVSLDRSQRSKSLKDIESRAVSWRADSAYHCAQDPSKINLFYGFDKKTPSTVGKPGY